MGCGATKGDAVVAQGLPPPGSTPSNSCKVAPDFIIPEPKLEPTTPQKPTVVAIAGGVTPTAAAVELGSAISRSKFDVSEEELPDSPKAGAGSPARGSVLLQANAKRLMEESGQTDVEKVAKTMTKDPHLLILYTGGTIGMTATEVGYAPRKGFLPQRMSELPMFQDPQQPRGTMPKSIYGRYTTYEIKEYEPLLDSSSMEPKDWIRIARDIEKEYANYDGFIVLHGTDTMSHTASALSFMLENLCKPVVVTGSQIPIAELRNDGIENLLDSMIVAGHFQIPEVLLLFRSRVFRGNRTWKESSHSLEGFHSPNLPALATVSITIDVDWDNVLPIPTSPLIVHTNLVTDIAVVTLYPGVSPTIVRAQLAEPVRGAVLQTFGAGNAPEVKELLDVFREASARGVLLVNVSQCRNGGVSSGAYAASAGLVQAKVAPLGDITLEAALTKMAVVLGRGMSVEAARVAMRRNLAGELADQEADIHLMSLSSAAFIRAVGKAMGTFGQESRAQIQKALLPVLACSAASSGEISELAGIFRIGESPDCCDYDNRAPLHIAAAEGHKDCVKFLLEKQADVNIKDRWNSVPLDDACLSGHTEVCDILIAAGGVPSKRLSDQLFEACHAGEIEKTKLMLKCKSDVNSVDYDGRSLLMLAARQSIDLVKVLLEAGADPSKTDTWGHTCSEGAKDESIKILLEEAANQALLDSVGH